jgi:sortase A
VPKLSLFTTARVAAVACMVAGAGFLGYTGYRIWDPAAREAQQQMTARLHRQWGVHPRPAPSRHPVMVQVGQPFALMRIPRFGAGWRFAIVEGTALPQLALGPGHVPGTALPGTPGNFAVAGHDITAGNPFLHLGTLRPGDAVLVQIAGTTYRYAVASRAVVRYTDTAALDPVPGDPGARPTAQYITLITCTPVTLAFTPWRIVVTGRLVQTIVTSAAR